MPMRVDGLQLSIQDTGMHHDGCLAKGWVQP